MCPVIRVSDELYSRLENYAVGFDSPSRVIERLLDQHEGKMAPESPVPKSMSGKRLFTNTEIQQRLSAAAQKLPGQELEELCDASISKDIFGINFPLLKRVPDTANQATKRKAVKTPDDVSRWSWKYEFTKDGCVYAICTQWYPRNDVQVKAWLEANET